MPPVRIALALALLALPAAASARSVCLNDAAAEFVYVFPKLKVPKKRDTVSAVSGLAYSPVSVTALPFSGTLLRDGNSQQLLLGITRFFPVCVVQAKLQDDLSGTVEYDCNLDGTSEVSSSLAVVECPDL
jgi:hypothetical protein